MVKSPKPSLEDRSEAAFFLRKWKTLRATSNYSVEYKSF